MCIRDSLSAVLSGGRAGHHRHVSAVYLRIDHSPEAHEEEQAVLLPDVALHQCVDDDLSHEAECGGTGEHLHPLDDGAGDAVDDDGPVCGHG